MFTAQLSTYYMLMLYLSTVLQERVGHKYIQIGELEESRTSLVPIYLS